jgi:hypothetical protein
VDFNEIHPFFHHIDRKVYKSESLRGLDLKAEEQLFLSKIGLPVIQGNYHTFLPSTILEIFSFNDHKLLKLGRPFGNKNKWDDNIIVLDPKTSQVLFYSESFFQIGLVSAVLTLVNNRLANFLSIRNLKNNPQSILGETSGEFCRGRIDFF